MKLASLGLVLALGSARVQAEEAPVELSVRYGHLFVLGWGGSIGGWQATVAAPVKGRLGLALDVGGHYVEGASFHGLLTGPRLSLGESKAVSVYGQVLAGFAFGGGAAAFVAYPGLGLDAAVSKGLAVRLQAEWPLITASGVIGQVPRFSAGIVWRPGRS